MIANRTGKAAEEFTQMRRIDFMEKYFPMVGGKEAIEPTTRKLFSFIFVRDPFSRLVSGYTQMMIHDWEKEALFRFMLYILLVNIIFKILKPIFHLPSYKWMRDHILTSIRKIDIKE